MTALTATTGSYRDRRGVHWRPTDPNGGPVVSDLAEVEQLADVIRMYRPVTGDFEAAQEVPQ